MQNQNRIFDDMAKVAGGALSALTALKQDIEGMIRDRMDRFMAEANYVRRDEFEAVKAVAVAARSEQERLSARLDALERDLAAAGQANPGRKNLTDRRNPDPKSPAYQPAIDSSDSIFSKLSLETATR